MSSKNSQTTPVTTSTTSVRQLLGTAHAQTAPAATNTAPAHQPLGTANRNDTSRSTDRRGRQNATTQHSRRREERMTVQAPVKKQQPNGMSHGGGVSSGGAQAALPLPGNAELWPGHHLTPPPPCAVGLARGPGQSSEDVGSPALLSLSSFLDQWRPSSAAGLRLWPTSRGYHSLQFDQRDCVVQPSCTSRHHQRCRVHMW